MRTDSLDDKLIGDLMIAYAPLWDIKMLGDKRKRRKWARKRRELRRRVTRELYENVGLMPFQRYMLIASMKGDII